METFDSVESLRDGLDDIDLEKGTRLPAYGYLVIFFQVVIRRADSL